MSEDETGLIYMRARYMDPVLGKFVSEDSARDGGNWYTYCGNNPVNAVDPDGRMSIRQTLFVIVLNFLTALGIFGDSPLPPVLEHLVNGLTAAIDAAIGTIETLKLSLKTDELRNPLNILSLAAAKGLSGLTIGILVNYAAQQITIAFLCLFMDSDNAEKAFK